MKRTPAAALLVVGIGLALLHPLGAPPVIAQPPAPAGPDVMYVPTPQAVVDAMLQLAEVKSTDVVYDLGSGDGRIVITAARRYGARGVGIEIDPELVKKAVANAAAAGVSERVRFVTQNLFDADISEATVVTLYLLQSINERLRPKLVRELKPGARVVSHVFNMGPEWPPDRNIVVGRSPVFLWTIRERNGGVGLSRPGAWGLGLHSRASSPEPKARQDDPASGVSWLQVHFPSRCTRVRLTEYLYLSAR